MLVGLKGDLTRQVQSETARSFATQSGYMYFEASAKSGQKDVNEVFCVSAAKALGIPLPPPPVSAANPLLMHQIVLKMPTRLLPSARLPLDVPIYKFSIDLK